MPKVLILTLHRPGRSPSQRFRFEQYLDFLTDRGFEFEWSYLLNAEQDKLFYQTGKWWTKFKVLVRSTLQRLKELKKAGQYDLVFVQRECFMLGTAFFEKQFARRATMIFDFDDAVWLPNVSDANKPLAFLKNPGKTADIIRRASMVLAGNSFLAGYARQFNRQVKVIPTTIDTEHYHNRLVEHKEKKQITIGWTGSRTTLKYLSAIDPVLTALSKKYPIRLLVICDKAPRLNYENVHFLPWRKETEIEDLLQFDIGIMPLADNQWTQGKCGFKLLQYMALGIPVVASPVGVNREIVTEEENGYLAHTPQEWIDKLSNLIESAELRSRFGMAGRKRVEAKYSVKQNRQHYLEAFTEILNKTRGVDKAGGVREKVKKAGAFR